jgi:putative ABC transport system permease protein
MRMKSDRGVLAEKNMVSPGYFRTLGIALVAGRDFGLQDAPGAPPVAIVSKRLATRLWPGENPLGKRIAVPAYRRPRRPPVEVIGVAVDAKYRSLVADAPLLLYLPLLQNREVFVSIQARTTGDPAASLPAVEQVVASLDRDMPVYNARTLAGQVALALWEQRTAAVLIGLFGVLALVVASVGLYSVGAQAVAHRTREIGIRMALGAQSGDVLGMLVGNGMALAVTGVLAGTAAATALTRFVASFLYGVSATDPATFVSIALVLLLVSLAASYLPARAATRIDPVAALRHE